MPSAPNAMALPGGLILVTDGLLDRVGSENELAFVLGHELGHFHNRDHLRRLGRGMVYGLLMAALTGGDPSLDPATFAGDLANRGFDREHERQADHFGLSLLQAEYGHVDGSWNFFESLLAEESDKILIIYLSTHPANATRIQELKIFAKEKGWPLEGELRSF
jgi:predicted Zn-dependent protease